MDKKFEGDRQPGGLSQLWPGPRTVIVPRTERGFGFTLRHFIVYPPDTQDRSKDKGYASEDDLEESYLRGARQSSSLEPMDTIFVKNVKDCGPAQLAGLNPGDRIISVNGKPVTGKSYSQVISLIQQSDTDLNLLVVPKDDDILQLAYQNSTQSLDSELSHSSVDGSYSSSVFYSSPVKPPSHLTLHSSGDSMSQSSGSTRDHRVSASTTSLESRNLDNSDRRYSMDRERSLTTSTSYTSGLSIFRDPYQSPVEENIDKNVFLDRKKEFELRSLQENVNPQSKTYSFGLYFPKQRRETKTRTNSTENLTRSTVGSTVVIRRSRENILQPNDSQENIAKQSVSQGRSVPVEYRPYHGASEQSNWDRIRSQENLMSDSGDSETYGLGSGMRTSSPSASGGSSRHSFPDSGVQIYTSPVRRSSETNSPHIQENRVSENTRKENYTTRQYVPVINQSGVARNQKISASVDSIDQRSDMYHSDAHIRTAYNSRIAEQSSQGSPTRTFIVKIGDSPSSEVNMNRSSTPSKQVHQSSIQVPVNPSYGTAFAVTRSPASAQGETRKGEARILVSHRKKQFENGKTDNTPTGPNYNRYKTEIEKFQTVGKFGNVASRLASFERQSSTESRSRSQTPVGQSRRYSQDRLKSPEPNQNGSGQNGQSQFQESAPIRIYVSQGTSNTSSSPLVEIVPMPSGYNDDQRREPRTKSPHRTVQERPDSEPFATDQTDGEPHVHNKPVRKASFLSAVNAPHSRYLESGYETSPTEPQPPTTASWGGQVVRAGTPIVQSGYKSVITPSSHPDASTVTTTSIITTPVLDAQTKVRMRAKPNISPEDYETKLHRRTSYLMATAKDRSVVNLTMSPTSAGAEPHDQTPAMHKHPSMRKLKHFFGEKTPKIVEATTESLRTPASPLQDIIKEGPLQCKVDLTDGKRASDRSWRPVWAVLRGHALYLCKGKSDAGSTSLFSYDEQPISIKSCIVDIAHSYTKKKNVFRLKAYNGSEYLFQADDQDSMLSWIEVIKSNNNPDDDDNGVANADLIHRKISLCEQNAQVKTSPPPAHKIGKKLSVLSMKTKMPSSPNMKRRKTSTEKDETSKQKTWKGKIGKSFRKLGSSPNPSHPANSEPSGMFGVPLECCTPSPNNEYVPLIVDMCTQIVEAKGLEMTGVYRIPGNKAAVTMFQEEFNKGIEKMNLDHDKLSDVNVISSLLKAFFRELPEPLITDDLYQPLIDASRIEKPERRMLKMKGMLHKLPEHHFQTFEHLAKHLHKVAQFGDVNKMEAKNLAIVFGPTLIRKGDDNMAAMFTDMSDYCKIIESIILHADWFFSSWDADNYVPTDDDATECTSIVSGIASSVREDLDNVSIDPRDIVTSILEAASRKVRGEQDKSSMGSLTGSSDQLDCSSGFSERDIDKEIILRSKKIGQIEQTSRSSPNLAGMQRASEIMGSKPMETISERRMAKSVEFGDREFADWEYMDSEKEQPVFSKPPFPRHFSEEALLGNSDELEISHGSPADNYAGSRLSKETLDSLRRIELEARALREREEKRQRDHERRILEKQRIEQDILRTEQELEIEERHSIEDLLNAPNYPTWTNPEYYQRLVETHHRTTAPTLPPREPRQNRSPYGDRGYSDQASGGKYFVSIGKTGLRGDSYGSKPPRQTSVESLVANSKRTGSLENVVESKGSGRPLAHVRGARKRDNSRGSKRDSAEINRHSNGALSRSNSVRRGSLDSLIDMIEKRDNRMSWASTDSEEGLDLLTTLTSTFDQKLQTLSSAKNRQGITANSRTVTGSIASNAQSTGGSSGVQNSSQDSVHYSAQNRLPPQVPLSQVSRQGIGSNSEVMLGGKQYRDPSLHRTPPKPEAKIGLATRFERSPIGQSYFPHVSSDSSLISYPPYSPLSTSDSFHSTSSSEAHVSSVMVVTPSPSVMSADSTRPSSSAVLSPPLPPPTLTQPLSLPGQAKWEIKSPVSRTDYRPITKSEKTEVNVNVKLSRSQERVKSSGKNVEFYCQESERTTSPTSPSTKSRSASPPPAKKKPNEKRKRRRHTVGGTNDAEHQSAVAALQPIKDDTGSRRSAWEQLQPRDSTVGPNSNMLSWLRNERLRGSSPDLLELDRTDITYRKN